MKNIGLFFISLFLFTACETVINPHVNSTDPMLVVDAWITTKNQTQEIVLTKTQDYFDSTTPPAASGATVLLTNKTTGKKFTFIENNTKSGHYEWTPSTIGEMGTYKDEFQLDIAWSGQTFTASSTLGRVPAVDSVTYKMDKDFGGAGEIVRAQFWATDPLGQGDAYWIRTTWIRDKGKKIVPLNLPEEINIAYDAGFSPNSNAVDGIQFIQPIRQAITPSYDNTERKDDKIVLNDSLYVEIHSITRDAFFFITEVSTQTNRSGGFAALFAAPVANVPTNIQVTKTGAWKAVGFFNVAAVSGGGKTYVLKK